jgi:hypothetical protein
LYWDASPLAGDFSFAELLALLGATSGEASEESVCFCGPFGTPIAGFMALASSRPLTAFDVALASSGTRVETSKGWFSTGRAWPREAAGGFKSRNSRGCGSRKFAGIGGGVSNWNEGSSRISVGRPTYSSSSGNGGGTSYSILANFEGSAVAAPIRVRRRRASDA